MCQINIFKNIFEYKLRFDKYRIIQLELKKIMTILI